MKFYVDSVEPLEDFESAYWEIDSLEDLKSIQDKWKNPLIIDFDDMEITIYNGYIE